MERENLPNDVQTLQNLLLQQKSMLSEQESQLAQQNKLIVDKDRQIADLLDFIHLHRRNRFAPSSESSQHQPSLFNELEETINDDAEAETNNSKEKDNKKRGKRKLLPDYLPREEIIIDLPEEQKAGMKKIGEEISEKLFIFPAKIVVKRTIRYKYALIDGGDIITAPSPAELLPKTMASSSLVAHIITAKYMDALPLYRQEKIFERIHASLTRQTMSRWLIQVSEKLIPLYNLLQDRCLDCTYLQMDETPTQVLNEDGKKATSKSYMWVRHAPGDNPIILYDYAPNRSGKVPLELLSGFTGALQVDGYDGYSAVCRENRIKRLGCMDHCRRYFFDASKTSKGKSIGKKGVRLIDKLYKTEERIKDLSLSERQLNRQEHSQPILSELKNWIDDLRSKITPKSVAGKAVNYGYNEWKYLIRYMDDPSFNISNIGVENAIRPFALGRKNWLFSASVAGANASAMYYSLIETAKSNGLEPFDYLNKMLEKLPSAKTVDDFEKLLPLKGVFQA